MSKLDIIKIGSYKFLGGFSICERRGKQTIVIKMFFMRSDYNQLSRND